MANAEARRQALREAGLEPSWRCGGKRYWLSSVEMSEIQERLDAVHAAQEKHACDLRFRPRAPDVVHMFWDDPEALLAGGAAPRELLPHDLLGLWSCLNVGMKVHLWSYSQLHVFRHSHLHHRCASDLLSRLDAVALLQRGLRAQHLADFIRCLAVREHGARVGEGSWAGDLDTIWIRPSGFCPSLSGHIFGTMHAKRNTQRGISGDIRYWKCNFVRIPDERVHFSNSPMAFPAKSDVLDSFLNQLRSFFEDTSDLSKVVYSAVVRLRLNSIRASGLTLYVMDPDVFHPMPHFVRAIQLFGVGGVVKIDGVEIPEAERVLADSSCVSQTWFSQSSSTSLYDTPIQTGSFYSKLLAKLNLSALDGASFRRFTVQLF